MNSNYYLSRTFNDVIFSNRNKLYGAYKLRRNYDKNIIVAFLIAVTLFSFSMVTLLIKSLLITENVIVKDKPKEETPYILEDIPIAVPVQKEKEVIPTNKKVKTVVYAEPKVVSDNTVIKEKELAEQNQLKDVEFGVKAIEGIDKPTDVEIPTNTEGNKSNLGTTNQEPFIYVEVMPEFEGGEKALMQYLGNKMRYPAAAQKEKVEGLVVVSFVVNPDGKISNAEILKGLGFGTDEEALRVISNMPAWKPGKQNGRPVAVRYTLPIRFSLKQ
jgi:periplasmic protein TonB